MNLIYIGIITTAIIATLLILLQERGDGAGSIFGGGGAGAYQNRRGVEKFMFIGTIFFVAAFATFCILNLAYPDKQVAQINPTGVTATDENGNPVDIKVTPVPVPPTPPAKQ